MLFLPWKLVKVEGDSMEPTFHEGDWILCTFARKGAKSGAIVVIEREEQPGIFYLKRVKEVRGSNGHEKTIFLLSDNPNGVDSRKWGWLPESSIIGQVMFRVRKKRS